MSGFTNPHFDLKNAPVEYSVPPRCIYRLEITCLYCTERISSEDIGHHNGKCIIERSA